MSFKLNTTKYQKQTMKLINLSSQVSGWMQEVSTRSVEQILMTLLTHQVHKAHSLSKKLLNNEWIIKQRNGSSFWIELHAVLRVDWAMKLRGFIYVNSPIETESNSAS